MKEPLGVWAIVDKELEDDYVVRFEKIASRNGLQSLAIFLNASY